MSVAQRSEGGGMGREGGLWSYDSMADWQL